MIAALLWRRWWLWLNTRNGFGGYVKLTKRVVWHLPNYDTYFNNEIGDMLGSATQFQHLEVSTILLSQCCVPNRKRIFEWVFFCIKPRFQSLFTSYSKKEFLKSYMYTSDVPLLILNKVEVLLEVQAPPKPFFSSYCRLSKAEIIISLF